GCDNERAFAARLIMRIDIRTAGENSVLDADGVKITGTHAEECESANRLHIVIDLNAPATPLSLPEQNTRGVKVVLPGIWTDRVPEERSVGAPLDAVTTAVLDV